MSRKFIDLDKKFSDSLLWELQNRAYEEFGPKAWAGKGVPSYLTSNPFMANRLVQMILGYLRDCLSPQAKTPLDLSEPVYIFDLGAGSGRLGYLILKKILPFLERIFPKELKVTYVMTDISEKNITFWQNHSLLAPFVKSGHLDFAYYMVGQDEPLKLREQNKTLDTSKNPVILIGTYFFDTVMQDLFRIHDKQLEVGCVSLSVDESLDIDDKDPEIINHIECHYDFKPIDKSEVTHPYFQEIASYYLDIFDNLTFLFPTGAFETFEYFKKLSRNRLLVCAADQGISSEKQLQHWQPSISLHGAFSFPVDYCALKHYLDSQKGHGFLTSFPESLFAVICGILGGNQNDFSQTRFAFEQCDAFEPKDYFQLINLIPEESLTCEMILLLIKLGGFDPVNFHHYFETLRKLLPKASKEFKETLPDMISKVVEQFFPINSEDGFFLSNCAVLLFENQNYKEALELFNQSKNTTGENAQTYLNLASCYKALNNMQEAARCINQAQKLL